MGKVVAIDGPSGAGKSTIAKELAKRLGFKYLDTGALYRAVALALREKGISEEDKDEALKTVINKTEIKFKDGSIFLNGKDVSEDIRSTDIGHYSSVFSARKVVRDFLLHAQREAAKNDDLVAEGRDMTTVVFPDAWKKFFLDASTDERAKRRYLQLKEQRPDATEEDARKDVVDRDLRDSSRAIAPLRKAEDAVLINSSEMSVNEVLDNIIKIVRSGN